MARNVEKYYQRSPRFIYWLFFFLFSLITAGSTIEATDRIQKTRKGVLNQEWAVGCSVASFGLAFVVVFLHFLPIGSVFIVNTKLEGCIIVFMIVLWSTLVGIITDSSNGLAVAQDGTVDYGNLYYSTWAGFIVGCLLFISYLKTIFFLELREELSMRSDRLNLWIGTAISAIVLMGSGANVFDETCAGTGKATKFCNRCILAMSDGFLGSVLSIVVIGMKLSTGRAPRSIEMLFSIVLFLVNAFSLGLVTCEEGPGAKIGNLFYFSWASMILPFLLLSSTYDDYFTSRQQQALEELDEYYAQDQAHEQQQQEEPMLPQDKKNEEEMNIEGGEGVPAYTYDAPSIDDDVRSFQSGPSLRPREGHAMQGTLV